MDKNRYFPKLEDAAKRLNRFDIPFSTAIDWSKKQSDGSNYRGLLYDRLSLYIMLEDAAEEKIKQLFSKKELGALWGCLKSTMYTEELLFMRDALSFGFADYCVYEEMEAAQFTDNLEVFAKQVGSKLEKLVEFERYVLLEFLRSEGGEAFIFGRSEKEIV